jgi:argininosuccinate lyase
MKKLWGARFKSELHDVAKRFSYSLGSDFELLSSEIKVSMVHAMMLGRAEIISQRDSKALVRGLKSIRAPLLRATRNRDRMTSEIEAYEDIHTWIQTALTRKIGRLADRLHTARSRNDLVTTSARVYLREVIQMLSEHMSRVQLSLLYQAEKNFKIVIPGYTHLQRAQVVLFSHHLLAYVEMLERDKSRLADARKRMNECPLGSAALSGSGLPIDRTFVARMLGFDRPTRNSLDAVSDRDFMIEILSAISILFMHLSRLTEDFILWSSQEFGFITLHDQFSTGSSLMPHKKNPDVLELIRGKTGEAYGNLVALLTTMKGLPLAYNRDMQEDKRPIFSSLHLAKNTLSVLELTIKTLSVNEENCAKASKDSFLFATDVLEYLVKKKVAFRQAHDIVGNLVKIAIDTHGTLSGLPLDVYKEYSSAFGKDVYDLFDPETSVAGKVSRGSTKPELVQKQVQFWKEELKNELKNMRRAKVRERVLI